MIGLKCSTVEDALSRLPSDTFTACLSDPPYGLDFMPQRTNGWDRRVPGVDVFRELLRVLRPGAFTFVFGHPRLFHRVGCNAEDAGFVIRDCVMWVYGTGNPKSRNAKDGTGRGTALKPAFEPIYLLQKPHPGTIAEAGAYLDIDAGRVAADFSERSDAWRRSGHSAKPDAEKIAAPPGIGIQCHPRGRWPANLVLDESAGAALDELSGTLRSGVSRGNVVYGQGLWGSPAAGSVGGASRFFYNAKASTQEREEGLEHFPMMLPPRALHTAGAANARSGAGRTGARRNMHPTVKPIALCQWLAGLLRGGASGPLLVPYSGVGSELIGASQAGWDDVIGIEMDPWWNTIAGARLAKRGFPSRALP